MKTNSLTRIAIVAGAAFALLMPAARASTVVDFTAANGATGEAVFTFGSNSLTLTLTDTVVNPNDVSFNLSGFMFTLAGATGGTLVSSSGLERTVNSDGTYTDGSTVATGWLFSASSGTYTLNDLGGAGPEHTLIGSPNGSNIYSNANASLKNDAHNPMLANTITFNFTFTGGVSPTSAPSNIQFQFGTTPGFSSNVPEPLSLSLVGGGLLALGLFRKRFSS